MTAAIPEKPTTNEELPLKTGSEDTPYTAAMGANEAEIRRATGYEGVERAGTCPPACNCPPGRHPGRVHDTFERNPDTPAGEGLVPARWKGKWAVVNRATHWWHPGCWASLQEKRRAAAAVGPHAVASRPRVRGQGDGKALERAAWEEAE